MKVILSLAATAVLIATGCGSSDNSTDLGYNGKFVDAGVVGVHYVCGDKSGTTRDGGAFGSCPTGSSVTFSIGNLVLGTTTAPANNIFTVGDVAGSGPLDTTNPEVVKLAALLLSLDDGGDAGNDGTVTISQASIDALNTSIATSQSTTGPVNLTSLSAVAVENTVTEVAAAPTTSTTVVTATQAISHIETTNTSIANGEIGSPLQPVVTGAGS